MPAGCEAATVGTPPNAGDQVRMPFQFGNGVSRFRIPDPHGLIHAPRGNAASGGITAHAPHSALVTAQRPFLAMAEREEVIPFPPAPLRLGALRNVSRETLEHPGNLPGLP